MVDDETNGEIHEEADHEVGREVIDLVDSPMRSPEASDTNGIDYDVLPEDAKDNDIAKWAWTTLLEQADCKRIILKLLHEMEPGLRAKVQEQLFIEFEKIADQIHKALQSLENDRVSIPSKYYHLYYMICRITRIIHYERTRQGSLSADTDSRYRYQLAENRGDVHACSTLDLLGDR